MKFIVLSSNKELIDSIKRYLKYVHSIKGVRSFLVRNPENDAYENFLVIRDWIEGLFENDITEMKRTMAFIDLPFTDFSNLTVTGDKESGLASLLYVAFPEIYWFFLNPFSHDSSEKNEIKMNWEAFSYFHTLLNKNEKEFHLENAIENFLYGYSPLFDPTRFRSHLIEKTLKTMYENEDITGRPFFLKRENRALVVDEELTYSYLHSYVAYKFNFSTIMTPTNRILKESRKIMKDGEKFDFSIEDICLSFPDQSISSILEEREKKDYAFLKNIEKRIFVTIGEKREIKSKNKEYRKNLKKDKNLKFYKLLYKPYAGIFNLKKAAKLKKAPPKRTELKEKATDHTQPGRLGLTAEILINRSIKVLSQAKNSNDAIYAAMLALQAQEILGGRTATSSIEAVSLKHQAEVMAECMFFGVEHNFDVKSRFKEIEKELRIIGKWFNKSTRDLMKYNSELNIINELARIFRHYSQFDEEQKCLNKVRSLNRKIYRKRNKFWGWLVTPLRWYFEFLVGSLPRFLAAIVLWPTLFTLLFYICYPDSFENAFIYSINSFFALQVTIIQGVPGLPILSILATLLGFFHLGIFISHLYTIVSRR
jgi:hypothetical protein